MKKQQKNRKRNKWIVIIPIIMTLAVLVTGIHLWNFSFIYIDGMRISKEETSIDLSGEKLFNFSAIDKYENVNELNLEYVELSEENWETVYKFVSGRNVVCRIDLCGEVTTTDIQIIDLQGEKIDVGELERKLKLFSSVKEINMTNAVIDTESISRLGSLFSKLSINCKIPLYDTVIPTDATVIDLSELRLPTGEVVSFEKLKETLAFLPNVEKVILTNQNIDGKDVEELLAEFPGIKIIWDVTAFGKEYSSDTRVIKVEWHHHLANDDYSDSLKYFTDLQKIDLTDNTYEMEEMLQYLDRLSEYNVVWAVPVGGYFYDSDSSRIELRGNETCTLEELEGKLQYFPDLNSIYFPETRYGNKELIEFGKRNKIKVIWDITLGGETFPTDVTTLDLTFRGITNIDYLKYCTELRKLDLSDNNIKNIQPLSNLTKLNSLKLWACKVSDISPIRNLTELNELDLRANKITDIAALSELTKLRELDLSFNNGLTNLEPLKNLTSLRILKIAYYDSKGKIKNISFLKNLTKLTRIEMYGNKISDISVLSEMTDLVYLDMEDNKITDISPLFNCSKISTIYMRENKIPYSQINKFLNDFKPERYAFSL